MMSWKNMRKQAESIIEVTLETKTAKAVEAGLEKGLIYGVAIPFEVTAMATQPVRKDLRKKYRKLSKGLNTWTERCEQKRKELEAKN